MPLELGIAMAQKFATDNSEDSHDWLLLVPKEHQYKRFISDMAGYDPKEYDQTKESAIPAVMSWLATRPDAVRTPTPKAVLDVLGVFETERNELNEEWRGDPPWADIVLLAMNVAAEYSLIPHEKESK